MAFKQLKLHNNKKKAMQFAYDALYKPAVVKAIKQNFAVIR